MGRTRKQGRILLQYLDPAYKCRNCGEFLMMFRRNIYVEHMNDVPGNSRSLYSSAIFGFIFRAFSFDSRLTWRRTVYTISNSNHFVMLVMLVPSLQIENLQVLYFLWFWFWSCYSMKKKWLMSILTPTEIMWYTKNKYVKRYQRFMDVWSAQTSFAGHSSVSMWSCNCPVCLPFVRRRHSSTLLGIGNEAYFYFRYSIFHLFQDLPRSPCYFLFVV